MTSDTQQAVVEAPASGCDEQPALTIRGASFTLAVAHIGSADLAAVEQDLATKVARAAELFRDAPLVIDLKDVEDAALDLSALVQTLRSQGLVPIAIRHGTEKQQATAIRAGLGVLTGGRGLTREAALAEPAPPPPAPEAAAPPAAFNRTVIQPVRSGQRAFAPQGDLVVLAPVNTGAEVLAAGNVHVYGPLRGRAMAGVNGDTGARILTTCLQAELVAVAGFYRVIEDDLPDEVRAKPAQIYLVGDRLLIEPLPAGGGPAAK